MKKILTVVLVLAGGIAVAISVLQIMGKLSPILEMKSGAVGVTGKSDGMTAVFVGMKAVPLIVSTLIVQIFSGICAINTSLLLRHAIKQSAARTRNSQ